MDDKRMEALMVGDLEPQTHQDKIFLYVYKHALEGQNLIDIMEAMIGELDNMTIAENWCFIFGYALGQKHAFEGTEELMGAIEDNNFH